MIENTMAPVSIRMEDLTPEKMAEWSGRLVHIHSDKGYWRPAARGYTYNTDEAWVVHFKIAHEYTKHCGPEKRVQYFPVREDHPRLVAINTLEDALREVVG